MQIEIFIQQFEESLDGLDRGTVSETTVFKELKEWDSLAILTLTDTIDLEYGVLLKKTEIESCDTVQSLYDLVQSKV
ncbi:MAG: acyl carrier protein [Coraliomargaritaceae bacterium]|jgi:acyl carrier protein